MADDLTIQQIRSMMDAAPVGRPQEIQPVGPQAPAVGPSKPDAPSFSDVLSKSIAEVNDLKLEANQAIEELATGKSSDIQGTIMAVEKADVSFKLMMEVRSKIISAYEEVMRTQV